MCNEVTMRRHNSDEDNPQAPFNAGSVHSTESLQNTDSMNNPEEEVVEVLCDHFMFDDDFAGQDNVVASEPDHLISQDHDIVFSEHSYSSFPGIEEINRNIFSKEPAEEIFLDSFKSSLHSPGHVVFVGESIANDALLEEESAGPSGVRCQSNASPNCIVAHSATNDSIPDEHAAGSSGEELLPVKFTPESNPSDDNLNSYTPAERNSGEPKIKTRRCRRSLHKDFMWKEVKELRKRHSEILKKYESLRRKYKSAQSSTLGLLSNLRGKISRAVIVTFFLVKRYVTSYFS